MFKDFSARFTAVEMTGRGKAVLSRNDEYEERNYFTKNLKGTKKMRISGPLVMGFKDA